MEKPTTKDLSNALQTRFCRHEWATFLEVGNGTSANLKRWADAISINLYPSRGNAILGFEIKISRTDLKKELDNPQKAEEIGKFCNEWYLVVPKGLINKTDIVPLSWGILEYHNGVLRQTKKPLPLEALPVTKNFLAAILRREDDTYKKRIKAEVEKQTKDLLRQNADNYEQNLKQEQESAHKRSGALSLSIAKFEEISGIKINTYNGERIGQAVAALNQIGVTGTYSILSTIRRNMETFLKETEQIKEKEVLNE